MCLDDAGSCYKAPANHTPLSLFIPGNSLLVVCSDRRNGYLPMAERLHTEILHAEPSTGFHSATLAEFGGPLEYVEEMRTGALRDKAQFAIDGMDIQGVNLCLHTKCAMMQRLGLTVESSLELVKYRIVPALLCLRTREGSPLRVFTSVLHEAREHLQIV